MHNYKNRFTQITAGCKKSTLSNNFESLLVLGVVDHAYIVPDLGSSRQEDLEVESSLCCRYIVLAKEKLKLK